jgi:hypothetical protein
MTRVNAKRIIQEEGLKRYNFDEKRNLRENEVGIKFEDNRWIVYATDERASIVTNSIFEFNSEEEALDDFIDRVRTEKVLYE